MARVEFRGLDELQKALKEQVTMNDIRTVVTKAGANMQKQAMRNAPVDTGNLRRSITLQSNLADRGLSAEVISRAHYSGYVENGTRYMHSKPFMKPAFNKTSRAFRDDLSRLLK